MSLTLQTSVEYVKGIGPKKAILLQQELQIYTIDDLLQHYPFRYEDRTNFHKITEISQDLPFVQLKGYVQSFKIIDGAKKRLVATFKDTTGTINLIWFQKINGIARQLNPNILYQIFGKLTIYNELYTIVHPEVEIVSLQFAEQNLTPIYPTTEKLKAHYIDSKYFRNTIKNLLETSSIYVPETIPFNWRDKYQLPNKFRALVDIHIPKNQDILTKAKLGLKFEEFIYIQLRLLQLRQIRIEKQVATVYKNTQLLHRFYTDSLPFSLTQAQKRVIKEIYTDLRSGKQMNRLLQGDVGSGKTMVAFLVMLIVLVENAQVAMMAPTEILAEQHYEKITDYANNLSLRIAILTGSTKTATRKKILKELAEGTLQVIIGTHSLINETVIFNNLGLAIIDEQHRFGVMQRAKFSQRDASITPHILTMSATPIPRTLAMTLYGDLDISIIDEMPIGRKPIKTLHYYDAQRLRVFQFIREQIQQGRQAYVVYPLIEESEKMDYKSLMDGYESICRAFPKIPISIIHGKMKGIDKDHEMQRFAEGETKIMVATTVIEVGINVPNATIMVIENAERFGLSQLHQLRGRVGRGQDQSYCILMTNYQLGKKSKERIQTLIRTNNGFEIADMDLKLRGPGDLTGIQQSGILALKIADLSQDGPILQMAREAAQEILKQDPLLESPANMIIRNQLDYTANSSWGNIS